MHYDLLGDAPDADCHALSYYWGAPGATKKVVIEGEEVQLRRSLWLFLDSLCRKYTDSKGTTVWLDVLSINQRDTQERNTQVEMMGQIYRQALDVHAWVGEGSADSNYAFRFVQETGFDNQRDRLESNEECPTQSEDQLKATRLALAGLEDLFLRPYWTRVWIVQESVVNVNLHLWCGDYTLDWDILVKEMRRLKNLISQQSFEHDDFQHDARTIQYNERSSVSWKYVELIDRARKEYAIARQRPGQTTTAREKTKVAGANLAGLAVLFGQQECIEPRDKIYGFRALASNGDSLKVDYTGRLVDLLMGLLSLETYVSAAVLKNLAAELCTVLSLTQHDVEEGLSDLPDDSLSYDLNVLPAANYIKEDRKWSWLYQQSAIAAANPRWKLSSMMLSKLRKPLPQKAVRYYFKDFPDAEHGDPIFHIDVEPDPVAEEDGRILNAGFYLQLWKRGGGSDERTDPTKVKRAIESGNANLLSMLNHAQEFCTIVQLGARICRMGRTGSGVRKVHLSRWALFALTVLRLEHERPFTRFLNEYAQRNPELWKVVCCNCDVSEVATTSVPENSGSFGTRGNLLRRLATFQTTVAFCHLPPDSSCLTCRLRLGSQFYEPSDMSRDEMEDRARKEEQFPGLGLSLITKTGGGNGWVGPF